MTSMIFSREFNLGLSFVPDIRCSPCFSGTPCARAKFFLLFTNNPRIPPSLHNIYHPNGVYREWQSGSMTSGLIMFLIFDRPCDMRESVLVNRFYLLIIDRVNTVRHVTHLSHK